jgi:diguanylate cyclase (GGDEF)-like protein
LEGNEYPTEFLKVSKFQSIKTRITIFSLLATIIPSLILGGLSYLHSSKLLREKISNELRNATAQTSKEIDLWMKERYYDLRVFASSYIISENLQRFQGKKRSKIETTVVFDQIRGYLNSICEKFGVYEELTLVDLSGEPLVTSSENILNVAIPGPWRKQLQTSPPISGFNPYIGTGSMHIAEYVSATNGAPLGLLVANIDLAALSSILKLRSVDGIDEIYLTESSGRLSVSSKPIDSAATIRRTPNLSDDPADYIGYRGKAVIGMASSLPSTGWIIVAEMEKDNAYADIVSLRRISIGLVGALIFCIGLGAFIFGRTVVRPVKRLSEEAASVAAGNLQVTIPVTGLSEVSYLTQVFNHMVASLRKGREEISAAHNSLLETNKKLHQISITDDLTGLHNRKHVMELLSRERVLAEQNNQPFSILMVDIDFFKKINDTYGHQTGDAVLRHVSETLRSTVREGDHIGRYGGEEFLIILPDSDIQSVALTADRIRQGVEKQHISAGSMKISVTISIGVSQYPDDGKNVEAIVRIADDALYQAKSDGRNRVTILKKRKGEPIPEGYNHSSNPNLRLICRN